MKLSELMAPIVPNASYVGLATANDMVLAIDTTATQDAAVGDFAVVQLGITGVDPSLNADTKDSQYLREGKSTAKTGTQRKFSVSGDMYIGDEAQDKLLSHSMKYATGQGAVVRYVFFNMLTGKGEIGSATVAVNKDGGGTAEDNATIDIELSKVGAKPEEFTWGNSVSLASLTIGGAELNPAFASATATYTAATTAASGVITAKAENDNAVIEIKNGSEAVANGGTAEWNSGENTVTVKVTNGSASPKTYTVTVTKSSE